MSKHMPRPDMRDYFRARIDFHTHGMLSRSTAWRPVDVARIEGGVTSPLITVTMTDGTKYHWTGGRYSSRKMHGCYPPLMPRPLADKDVLSIHK